MTNVEELERALNYPWDKWTVFLHPIQRDLVERSYGGPVRVSGSAGTGKTVVALHRAVHLARRRKDARLLLTTFSSTLAKALEVELRRLVGNEPRVFERIEVHSMNDVGRRLHTALISQPQLADDTAVRRLISESSGSVEAHRFSDHFLWTEWNEVADAWQLNCWEAYRDVARLGRKTRLGEKQRKLLWSIFERVRQELADRDLLTTPTMLARVTDHLTRSGVRPYQFAVVDESQDSRAKLSVTGSGLRSTARRISSFSSQVMRTYLRLTAPGFFSDA